MKAVGRSENPGVPLLFGGPNLPKSGWGMPHPAPPGTTLLSCIAGIKGPWVSNEDKEELVVSTQSDPRSILFL